MCAQNYRNPPVIEVICELGFEGSQTKPPWSGDIGRKFLRKVVPSQEQVEVLPESLEFTPEGIRFKDVARMRIRDKNGRYAVQVGRDFLACHLLRHDEPYEFGHVVEHVLAVLPVYTEFFEPARVNRMGLWYVDQIKIPGTGFRLEDYFNLGVKLPGNIVTISCFDVRVVISLRDEPSNRVLDLHVQDIGGDPEEHARFRLDWHLVEDLTTDIQVTDWLQAAHKELNVWFEESLTPRCRALFGPVKGGPEL